MKSRRVKITGVGFVTPAGTGVDEFRRQILEPVSRMRLITRWDPAAGAFVGAEVDDFGFRRLFPDRPLKRQSRQTAFALAAARLALLDAGLDFDALKGKNPGLVIGTSLMDCEGMARTVVQVVKKGPRFALPRLIYSAGVCAATSEIADEIGAPTRSLSLQSACCSGLDAIGHAAAEIAAGKSDIALCGGTEAPIFYHPMLELRAAGLSPLTAEQPAKLARPFDRWRTTGVIGEGACMLVIESEDSPRPGYAWVKGYSSSSEDESNPGAGMARAITESLANARIRPEEIDLINAWGPGHRLIDAVESSVLAKVFGRHLPEIPTVSIKAAIGNPLGAAGAIQAGCAALSLRHGEIPPTVNWEYPDPACPLNLSREPRYVPVRRAIVNSHGLSGANACLVLERC